PGSAVRYLASCALTYAAVYAKTRHIGPPQSVYDDFHRWGVRNEGFASPFNARLLGKQDAGFFSLFPHVDHVFGSRGSFYRTDLASHEGAWSVDPPFIPETLSRAERKIADWMAAGAAAPVIWIGPSSYRVSLPVREHVRLRAGVHSYEALDGGLHLLPVDVSILLIGELPGFDAEAIVSGYTR
ncbi:MAG: CTD-interacting factor, partial [Myxococcota bacterium]